MTDEVKGAEAPVAAASVAEKKNSSIFDMFETDSDVETKGVLLRYGPDIRILVARAGGANKAFERIIKTLTKPHRQLLKAVQSGNGSDADALVLENIMKEAYAKTVVLGWEGIQLERNGPLVECKPENVLALFNKIPQMWIDIRDFASNYINFLSENTEEVAKN